MPSKPFIYIASLRRTGSTVLAEALTAPPHSFIFREPHFGRNRFSLKDDDAQMFSELGIPLADMRECWLADRKQRHVLEALKEEFLPLVTGHFAQLGAKEIRHEGWRGYWNAFPEMKIILTGRDPRDVYLSLYARQAAGRGSWRGEYTPQRVADDLLQQFAYQKEMAENADCIRVRYEDLCTDDSVFEQIKQFIDSDIPGVGRIGVFLSNARGRKIEDELHGGELTNRRVARWKREKNPHLVEEAHACFDLMDAYNAFWGYATEPREVAGPPRH